MHEEREDGMSERAHGRATPLEMEKWDFSRGGGGGGGDQLSFLPSFDFKSMGAAAAA